MHSQSALLSESLWPFLQKKGRLEAQASLACGQNRSWPRKTHSALREASVEEFSHGGREEAGAFAIGQGTKQETSLVQAGPIATLSRLGHDATLVHKARARAALPRKRLV